MALEPALALLNRFGFNLVQRPEVRLRPLDVLGRDDLLEQIGSLPAMFDSTAAVPTFAGPQPAAAFAGQQTELIHVSVAERILVRLLNGLGSDLQAVQLDPQRTAIRFVRFSFMDVAIVSVAVEAIGAYLFPARPRPGPLHDRYFANPEADAYVVSEVLQAGAITVQPLDVGSEPAVVDVPALAARIGGSIDVTMTAQGIRFSGPEAATVAFKCWRVALAGGTWGLEGASGHPLMIAPGTRVMVHARQPAALAS